VKNDEQFAGMLLEKEAALDKQHRSPYRKASTGSTKCPSLEASSDEKGDSQEEDSQEEEEDSAYVKKKKERAYLPRLGYSQQQLDLFTVNDETSNVPEPQSSPHGSALTAIKRKKLYKREKLEGQAELDALCVTAADEDDEQSPQYVVARSRKFGNVAPSMPVPVTVTDFLRQVEEKPVDQAELDALCVDAEDDDEEDERKEALPSPTKVGSPGSLLKNEELDDEEEETHWSPWNSPRRSNASSPGGERGQHRAKSPVHGGA